MDAKGPVRQPLRLVQGILQKVSDDLVCLIDIGGDLGQVVLHRDLQADALLLGPALEGEDEGADCGVFKGSSRFIATESCRSSSRYFSQAS